MYIYIYIRVTIPRPGPANPAETGQTYPISTIHSPKLDTTRSTTPHTRTGAEEPANRTNKTPQNPSVNEICLDLA